MTYAVLCIPDADLRDQIGYMFHHRGYRVVAEPAQARADEAVIATVAPGQTEMLTATHRLPRGGAVSLTETSRCATLRVDIGDVQAELDPPHVFDTDDQFVAHIIGFAECPGDYLDLEEAV